MTRSTRLDMPRWELIAAGRAPAASREALKGTPSPRMLAREDGRPERRGARPAPIQCLGRHPADALPPRGVAVSSVPGTPITVVLQTPKGEVTLEST